MGVCCRILCMFAEMNEQEIEKTTMTKLRKVVHKYDVRHDVPVESLSAKLITIVPRLMY